MTKLFTVYGVFMRTAVFSNGQSFMLSTLPDKLRSVVITDKAYDFKGSTYQSIKGKYVRVCKD